MSDTEGFWREGIDRYLPLLHQGRDQYLAAVWLPQGPLYWERRLTVLHGQQLLVFFFWNGDFRVWVYHPTFRNDTGKLVVDRNSNNWRLQHVPSTYLGPVHELILAWVRVQQQGLDGQPFLLGPKTYLMFHQSQGCGLPMPFRVTPIWANELLREIEHWWFLDRPETWPALGIEGKNNPLQSLRICPNTWEGLKEVLGPDAEYLALAFATHQIKIYKDWEFFPTSYYDDLPSAVEGSLGAFLYFPRHLCSTLGAPVYQVLNLWPYGLHGSQGNLIWDFRPIRPLQRYNKQKATIFRLRDRDEGHQPCQSRPGTVLPDQQPHEPAGGGAGIAAAIRMEVNS